MRVLLNYENRPRPAIVCPVPRSEGDMCHEEEAEGTSVQSILTRYAGNLEEMMAWRTRPQVYDCDLIPSDLQEAYSRLEQINEMVEQLELPEGMTLAEAMESVRKEDYSPWMKKTEIENQESSNEAPENQQTEK